MGMYGSIAASWCDIVRGRRMPPYSAYARLRYTTPWQAGSIYLNSQRPYSRKRATSRLLCQKQALHIFTRRRRTSRSQRNADCTNRWRIFMRMYESVWEHCRFYKPHCIFRRQIPMLSHTFPYILIYSVQCGVPAIGLYFVFTSNKGVAK